MSSKGEERLKLIEQCGSLLGGLIANSIAIIVFVIAVLFLLGCALVPIAIVVWITSQIL